MFYFIYISFVNIIEDIGKYGIIFIDKILMILIQLYYCDVRICIFVQLFFNIVRKIIKIYLKFMNLDMECNYE